MMLGVTPARLLLFRMRRFLGRLHGACSGFFWAGLGFHFGVFNFVFGALFHLHSLAVVQCIDPSGNERLQDRFAIALPHINTGKTIVASSGPASGCRVPSAPPVNSCDRDISLDSAAAP